MTQQKVVLELTIDQARAVKDALDAYTRLCIGQINIIEELVRSEVIPLFPPTAGTSRQVADTQAASAFSECLRGAKGALGYPTNGSMSIGHPHVHLSGRRAYEVEKVLSAAISESRNPAVEFRGMDCDGLVVRYTQDPKPKASVVNDFCKLSEAAHTRVGAGNHKI